MVDRPEVVPSAPDPPLGRVLKGGWRWLVAGATLGVLVGVVLLMVLPKSYGTGTAVIVRPIAVLDNVGTSPTGVTEVNLDTEAQLVQSLVVAEAAREELGTQESADALLANVSVSVPPNTTILNIRYTADTAEAARAGAAAFAEAYLQEREDSAEAALLEQRDTLDDQVQTLTAQLKALSRRVSESEVGSSERLTLSARLRLLQGRLGEIQSTQLALESTQIAPGEVVSPAELPETPTNPKPTLVLPSALALGLLGGILLAWSTRWRRERLLSPRDLVELGDAPVVGVVDASESEAGRGVQQLIHTLVAEGQNLLLVPAASRQSSLRAGLVVGRQLARLKDHCLVVVPPEEHDRVTKWDVENTQLTILRADDEQERRHRAREGIPTVFVSRPVKKRSERPVVGIDFAVVTVRAGATTAAQLRNTVARLEGNGVTVRGALLDRGAGETAGQGHPNREGGPSVPRQNEPAPTSRPSTVSTAPET